MPDDWYGEEPFVMSKQIPTVYTKSLESGVGRRELKGGKLVGKNTKSREKEKFPTIRKSRRISRLLVSFPTNFPTFSYLLGSLLKFGVGSRETGTKRRETRRELFTKSRDNLTGRRDLN